MSDRRNYVPPLIRPQKMLVYRCDYCGASHKPGLTISERHLCMGDDDEYRTKTSAPILVCTGCLDRFTMELLVAVERVHHEEWGCNAEEGDPAQHGDTTDGEFVK